MIDKAKDWSKYLVAVVAIIVATCFRLAVDPIVGDLHPFVTYIFAIIFTAWYCGMWPAMLSLVLGFLSAAYFFVSPRGSVAIYGLDAQVGTALYIVIVVGISSVLFSESMHTANRRAIATADELRKKQTDLETEIEKRKLAQRDNKVLLRRFVSVQEEERRRISRELHDQCGQDITALQLGLKVIEDSIAVKNVPNLVDRIKEWHSLLETLSREIHELALELRPPSLDDLGLQTAVESYLVRWSSRTRIPYDFECRNLESHSMPSEISTAIYRVIQESLTNVAKHSKTARVSVILQIGKCEVSAIVEDQGVGFSMDSRLPSSDQRLKLGILGMRERIESIGGALEIESEIDSGTTIFAKVPIAKSFDPAKTR